MNRPAILYASAVDVVNRSGEVFVRLWQGETVVAVAGLNADNATELARQLQDAALETDRPSPISEAVH